MAFSEERFLLSERENPHSRERENGVSFWGYPTRRSAIRTVVVHTAETSPTSGSAMAVARWQAFTASEPSSYHVLTDSANVVRTLEDEATAFHVVGHNSPSLGLSFATRASLWGRYPGWDREALKRGAWVAARWARRYSIPLRWLTKAQADAGQKGFVFHATMDPARRTDPGANFPAAEFFRLVSKYLKPEPTTPEEDIVASIEDLKEVIRETEGPRDELILERVNEALRLAQAAATYAVAKVREEEGLEPDPESDAIQVARLRRGEHAGWKLRENPYRLDAVRETLREKAEGS